MKLPRNKLILFAGHHKPKDPTIIGIDIDPRCKATITGAVVFDEHNRIYVDTKRHGKRPIERDCSICASPPCNYFSRANYRRETSKYSLETKHLLPKTIIALHKLPGVAFLVENVRNEKLIRQEFASHGLEITDDFGHIFYEGRPVALIYTTKRHTYFTNTDFVPESLPDGRDYNWLSTKERQGDIEVRHNFEKFLENTKKWCKII